MGGKDKTQNKCKPGHDPGAIPYYIILYHSGEDETEYLDHQGTMPVPYRGQNYNIPVSLYLLDTHPYHAPLCYVKPTPDMQVI